MQQVVGRYDELLEERAEIQDAAKQEHREHELTQSELRTQGAYIRQWQQTTATVEARRHEERQELERVGEHLEPFAEHLNTKDFMLDIAADLQRQPHVDPQQTNRDIVTFTTEMPKAPAHRAASLAPAQQQDRQLAPQESHQGLPDAEGPVRSL